MYTNMNWDDVTCAYSINNAVSGESQRFLFDETDNGVLSRYYGSTINLIAGSNTLRMDDDEPFAMVLYSDSSAGDCLATYTGGQCLDTITGVGCRKSF